ncbi:MAG: hypothetical protein NXI24_20175 [bacterium]|nr:hypothetical protein [bacterium]
MTAFKKLSIAISSSSRLSRSLRRSRRSASGPALPATALVLLLALDFAGAGGRASGELLAQDSRPKTQKSVGQAKSFSAGERLVRIRVVVNLYETLKPYAAPGIHEWVGSGIWLGDGRVLTDLRLVRFASVIEYWPPGADPGKVRPIPARLEHRGHDCGLAVVAKSGEGVSDRVPAAAPALFAGPGASVGDELKIFGYGSARGATVYRSKARGVLVREYDPAGKIAGSDIDEHPLYRVDAVRSNRPPQRSYSGGPAVIDRRLVGVYMNEERTNHSYVLSAGVARAFLADIAADGRYDGFPRTGLHFESIGSDAAQRYLGLRSAKLKNAVLVRRVDFQSAAWGRVRPGDILLSANGKAVDYSGRIIVSSKESVPFERWLRALPGAPLKLKLLRNGNPLDVQLDLESPALRSPGPGRSRLLDQPKYFLGGGLVFQELEYDVIHADSDKSAGDDATARGPRSEPEIMHRYYNYYTDRIGEQVDRDIILTGRLADPVNADADRFINGIVRSVNGRRIRNLKDFAAEWTYTREAHVVVEFLNHDQPLILDFAAAREAAERIRTRYRVQENGRVR